LQKKRDALVSCLKEMDSLLIAFSGGVDSTLLLSVAREVLGKRILAVTAGSIIHRKRDIKRASDFCGELGIRHLIVEPGEMKVDAFLRNGEDRCFQCKKILFRILVKIAHENAIDSLAHGANYDDLNDYRPGFRAAQEAGVAAPMVDVRLTKQEIREISRQMHLTTSELPSSPCLATRIPYGSPITEEKLVMIDKAEEFLEKQGFSAPRVRHHGSVARIEVMRNEIGCLLDKNKRGLICEKIKGIGFDHVSVDLEGYISGKMNRSVKVGV